MRLRNDATGYGLVSKALHWLTVLLLVGQVVLGYTMEGLAEAFLETDERDAGDDQLVFVHAGVGVAILAVGLLRLLWRATSPLPPWSERLSARDRRLEALLEKALLTLLVVVPVTGLALLYASGEERELADDREWLPPLELAGDDLLLALHVAGQIALYVAVAAHVALGLRRRTVTRML